MLEVLRHRKHLVDVCDTGGTRLFDGLTHMLVFASGSEQVGTAQPCRHKSEAPVPHVMAVIYSLHQGRRESADSRRVSDLWKVTQTCRRSSHFSWWQI